MDGYAPEYIKSCLDDAHDVVFGGANTGCGTESLTARIIRYTRGNTAPGDYIYLTNTFQGSGYRDLLDQHRNNFAQRDRRERMRVDEIATAVRAERFNLFSRAASARALKDRRVRA